MVEIDTTLSAGSCTEAATAMKARLLEAGYPESDLHVIVSPGRPKDGNLIAVLHGTGVSGIFSDGATTNAHGLNERIRVQSLMEGREFPYRLIKLYAGGK